MEKYYKIKCKECGEFRMAGVDDIPEKFDIHDEYEGDEKFDEDNYICKKCQKEIESKRMNHCNYCDKNFKPSEKGDYADICQKCYDFIMNEYKPTGMIKKIFEILPCDDECLDWKDVAEMRYGIYKLLKVGKEKQ